MRRLKFDEELRNVPRDAMIGIDDILVKRLRAAVAGRADNDELRALIGSELERFRAAGNFDAEVGSDEWRVVAIRDRKSHGV